MAHIVFYDPSFPFAGIRPDSGSLSAFGATTAAAGLAAALAEAGAGDVLLHLHGAHVPRAAWPALCGFVARGGHLVTLGRQPFSRPVDADGTVSGQAALFRDLDIHEMLAVDVGSAETLTAGAGYRWLADHLAAFSSAAATDGFVLMPTRDKDQPLDSGSAGPMDARIYPLLSARNAAGHAIASPVVLIERLRGAAAGSRQVFANIEPDAAFWANGGVAALLALVAHAALGVTEWWIKPDYACYHPGETVSLTVQGEALGATPSRHWQLALQVSLDDEPVFGSRFDLDMHDGAASLRISLPEAVCPGLYRISAALHHDGGGSVHLQQGFWGRDDALLARGERLAAGRDYLMRDGKPMPVVGMTYMASDVHRKFLQLPNVAVWDDDMATLAGMGVNYLRTGVWSAWRQLMFVDGHANEAALRAIDAFIHTAALHDLECCFTFFAFTPEAWEGANPYLDPRSRAAQKRFIRAIVGRHTETRRVHWDLINEPSLFDPARIFVGPRSLGDAFEMEAFRRYLQARNPDLAHWQAAWDVSPAQLPDWSALRPPQPDEIGFNTTEILPKQHGIWLDYALFTQHAHAEWAADLAQTIRNLAPEGAPGALVCVGQDEALGQQRPSPFFYADAVDYTTVHSWWLNDALGWDSLFSKTPNAPNVVQETGIMHVERPDGRSRRSEAELYALLERKYAWSYAFGNAGAVHWIWNINYHMDNINESHIGACRADGSMKPEAEVTAAFGALFGAHGARLTERQLPDVAVVYPFSNDYSNRRSTLDATQALVRSALFELGLPLRAVGDHDLSDLFANPPKLILLPSPHNLNRATWAALEALLDRHDITVLLTGPADLDEYWRPTGRIAGAGTRNLNREETLLLAERRWRASFGGEAIARLSTGDGDGLVERTMGRGRLLWCPLPLELNQRTDVLDALYRHALVRAGVTLPWRWLGDAPEGVALHRQAFADRTLWIVVSEAARDHALAWHDLGTGRSYTTTLAAGRALVFVTDEAGTVVGSLRDQPVAVA
ncbi:glycoside hydrolase [Jeongeupia chitinilytica]|uniref:Glycoside hydrolase n=1 Tax=Jeongeupia chitinilytica TaxID=1041641 RepID=A0ABQ3H7S3_9NEIS|nr:glycoside hydrolase [Jeongeupia chitinilytica]GHD69165.1 hypothetical protein GCM10007350_35560 [Jeongeupia chitinilytica]